MGCSRKIKNEEAGYTMMLTHLETQECIFPDIVKSNTRHLSRHYSDCSRL